MNSAIPIQGTLRVWHHESSPLRSPRDSDSTPRQWQRSKVVEGQQAATALALQQLQRDVNRLRMRPQSSGPALGPITHYDKDESYSAGSIVAVLPTDELVTDGLLDEETEEVLKAPAGFYYCQKSVSPVVIDPEADPLEYRYNAPKWPLETADDVEAENTYWVLLSLYPAVVTKCVNGEPTDSYENTQPVPEQPT